MFTERYLVSVLESPVSNFRDLNFGSVSSTVDEKQPLRHETSCHKGPSTPTVDVQYHRRFNMPPLGHYVYA